MRTTTRVLTVLALILGLATMGCAGGDGTTDPGVDTAEPGEDTAGSGEDTVGPEPDGIDPCIAACEGLECGDGGVEGCDCGTCEDPLACLPGDYLCGYIDYPDCDGKECGPDDMGGSCGECEVGETCNAQGLCEPCVADCAGKECGDDGCGGSCGTCETGSCHPTEQVCVDCFPAGSEPTFSDTVVKINALEIGEGGLPGYAVDVDGDPGTCAPVDACQDGLDNALGGLLDQIGTYVDVNVELTTALDEGTIILLAELVDGVPDGGEFLMNFYLGMAVEDKETCDWQTAVCDYLVNKDSFDLDTCAPLIFFDNATITGDQLAAGGPDAIFSITIPLDAGLVLTANAYMARITATTVLNTDMVVGFTDGVVGGAVDKQELLDTCKALPDDLFEELGMGKDLVCGMLDMFIQPDIDRDDDGTPDAASVGIAFGAIQGAITGLYENLLD